MTNKIRQINHHGLRWLHCTKPGEAELEYIREQFKFYPLDLEDCVKRAHRPKIDNHDDYVFLILLFPYYRRSEHEIVGSEIDYFAGPNYLVTLSDGKTTVIDNFFEQCLKSKVLRDQYLKGTSAQLVYELLTRQQEGIFPMLDHVFEDISEIETEIFSGREKQLIQDILQVKRNIVNLRRIMNAHKTTIKKFINKGPPASS